MSPFVIGLLVAGSEIAGSTVVAAAVVVVVAAVVVPTLVVVFVQSWTLGRGPALLYLRLASFVLGLLPVGGAVGGGHVFFQKTACFSKCLKAFEGLHRPCLQRLVKAFEGLESCSLPKHSFW